MFMRSLALNLQLLNRYHALGALPIAQLAMVRAHVTVAARRQETHVS
jgi:hypothetical protein